MRSIRVKLTAITIAAILTSILSVFLTCTATIERENERDSVEVMNLTGISTQAELESYLEGIEQSVNMAANMAADGVDSVILAESGIIGEDPGKAKRTDEQIGSLDKHLASYCSDLQKTFSSIAIHTPGVITYYYCINPEVSENEHGFFYSRVGKTGFFERDPLDARELDPNDTEHTTWYYTPIRRGRPSWVGPYKAHFLNELITYSYLVPIYRSGTLIGVLGLDIPFETLTTMVSEIKIFDTGYAFLLNEKGRVMYHPELEFNSEPVMLDESIREGILKSKSSGEMPLRYMSDGEKWQMSFTTLSNGMKLVVTAPMREVNASRRQLNRIMLINTIMIVVVFSLIMMLVIRYMTRPLQKLTEASQRLASDEYDVELSYSGRDEIGTLTTAFSQMRDKLRLYIEDLNRRINTDALTGVPNMRYFFKLAEEQREEMAVGGKTVSVLFFNLIGMKYYNRQLGFVEGDKLLCEFARILARHYGEQRVSRLGQDHFVALTDSDDVETELEEVFLEIESANGWRGLPVRVGIYPDWQGEVDISNACDRAKYAYDRYRDSTDSGWYYFDDSMLEQIHFNRYIIDHFDRAIDEEWLQVYYQPIIRSSTGIICDEEALSRWMDPERGMLPPGDFIPVLENAGLIYKLDLYVLDHIIEKLQILRSEGIVMLPHSLNLSRADFDACDIVEEVRRRMDDAGLPRELLSVEITESIVGTDFDYMKKQIERFKDLGFLVWMDDFGSGYSALDVLQDIDFDLIKVDMRFMQRFNEGRESRIILTQLLKMTNELGIDTVVEGVETEAQRDFLREAGCTKMQGYYFSRPVPTEECLERCRRNPLI